MAMETIDNVVFDNSAWRGFSDRVMGGVSRETVGNPVIDGEACVRLTGDVRLDNNGGFIQMAIDLAAAGKIMDATAFAGILLRVWGNGEPYGAHLRTADVVRPWQSYRAVFVAEPRWRNIAIPFTDFQPYRLPTPLNIAALRRLGLVAIGRAFHADLAIARASLYR